MHLTHGLVSEPALKYAVSQSSSKLPIAEPQDAVNRDNSGCAWVYHHVSESIITTGLVRVWQLTSVAICICIECSMQYSL